MAHDPAVPVFKRRRDPPKEARILGLELDRKTNVLSLAAFMLSTAGIAGQVYFFVQGPKVSIQPPEQAVFYAATSADGRSAHLKIAARMAYVNTGQPGFNDAIQRETASLRVGDRTYQFFWKKYVASDSDGMKFVLNAKGDALPVAVGAGSVEAHETSFSPIPTFGTSSPSNHVEFSEFASQASLQRELVLTLRFETFSGAKGAAVCRIVVDEPFRNYLKNGWIAPLCR